VGSAEAATGFVERDVEGVDEAEEGFDVATVVAERVG